MTKTRPMNGKKNLPTLTAIISKWTFTSVWSFASLRENCDDLYMRFYVLFFMIMQCLTTRGLFLFWWRQTNRSFSKVVRLLSTAYGVHAQNCTRMPRFSKKDRCVCLHLASQSLSLHQTCIGLHVLASQCHACVGQACSMLNVVMSIPLL